ncbi:MAG TPA: tRNA pseudouridine(55) synthase TruB [Acholeplasmataceae bacterium]|nr:tRNA pseudouridine(55) synthase TruB [Acholeplasmataceae bacterium]
MNGIVLINKPVGITSFDVVITARKVFETKKIGHTGTLDPFASGLLILCVGKATKLVDKFLNANKEYVATIKFGNHYDTFDTTGKIINTDSKDITEAEFIETINTFKGAYLQKAPIYSAIKIDGKKLYEYARKNIEVDTPTRKVFINDINYLTKVSHNIFKFSVDVSKGTYIRSLAVDIADKLNTFAALDALVRTKIANYHLNDSVNLDKLTKDNLITFEMLFKDMPKIELSDYLINLVKNGIYLDERQTTLEEDFIVIDKNNKMIAYYEMIAENQYKPVIIF